MTLEYAVTMLKRMTKLQQEKLIKNLLWCSALSQYLKPAPGHKNDKSLYWLKPYKIEARNRAKVFVRAFVKLNNK